MKILAQDLRAGQTIKLRLIEKVNPNNPSHVELYGEGATQAAVTTRVLKKSPSYIVEKTEFQNELTYKTQFKTVTIKKMNVYLKGIEEPVVFSTKQKVLIIE
jgi:hypothetical protein